MDGPWRLAALEGRAKRGALLGMAAKLTLLPPVETVPQQQGAVRHGRDPTAPWKRVNDAMPLEEGQRRRE